jgi:hypothetical protein
VTRMDAGEQERPPSARIDTTVPQTARVWNYWLGGKDNFPVDRQVGDEMAAAFPLTVAVARAVRGFLSQAVRYLAGEQSIRQFLDVGTGLPTANNTHEVAQSVAPESRIVYVDNDPLVLVHARALLTSDPLGATDYIEADARNTDLILEEAARTLDFDRPMALMLLGILAHLPYPEAVGVVRRLLARMPSGCYLVFADGDDTNAEFVESMRIWNESSPLPYEPRSREQIMGYFEGLELFGSGLTDVGGWSPDPNAGGPENPLVGLIGVGKKP